MECVNLSEEEQYVDIPVLNYPNYIAEDSAGETIYRIDAEQKGKNQGVYSGLLSRKDLCEILFSVVLENK